MLRPAPGGGGRRGSNYRPRPSRSPRTRDRALVTSPGPWSPLQRTATPLSRQGDGYGGPFGHSLPRTTLSTHCVPGPVLCPCVSVPVDCLGWREPVNAHEQVEQTDGLEIQPVAVTGPGRAPGEGGRTRERKVPSRRTTEQPGQACQGAEGLPHPGGRARCMGSMGRSRQAGEGGLRSCVGLLGQSRVLGKKRGRPVPRGFPPRRWSPLGRDHSPPRPEQAGNPLPPGREGGGMQGPLAQLRSRLLARPPSFLLGPVHRFPLLTRPEASALLSL